MLKHPVQNPSRPAISHNITAADQELDLLTRLVSVVAHAPMVAIHSLDSDGIVQSWDVMSGIIYGIAEHDALGKHISELLSYKRNENNFLDILKRIRETGLPELSRDWSVKTKNGKEVLVYSSMFPVFHEGHVKQIFCMDIDISMHKEEQQALLEMGANFRALFERSADAIILMRHGKFIEINPAALKLFGFTQKIEMLGLTMLDLSSPVQLGGGAASEQMAAMIDMAEESGNHHFEWHFQNFWKKEFCADVLFTSIPVDGERRMYVVVRDITQRKIAEQSLYLAAQVFENSREAIMIADKNQRIISLNHAFIEMTGYSEQELVGNTPHIYSADLHDSAFYDDVWNQINAVDHWQGEIWDKRRDGSIYPAWVSITAFRDANNNVSNYMSIISDITQRKKSEEYTRHLAEHDFLTDLPNRVLLLDRLGQALAAANRNGTQLAILFLDLDRFKNINDTLGHHIGDKLLQAVAMRLKKCVRGIDTVSRQGGDEFVVMLADIGGVEQAATIAEYIMNALSEPYKIEGNECIITTSIGISTYPNDGEDMDTLIKNADIAMYHAKENGRSSYQFFNKDMNARIVKRLTIETNLQQALNNNEFVLQYQPEIDIASGRMVGAEALIRWQHPEQGMLTPTSFISIAEDSGLIVPIGDWVLRTACRQARLWQDQGWYLVIAVNVSIAQLRQKNLLQKIKEALQLAGLAPEYLELEISESHVLEGNSHLVDVLNAIKALGVKLAIDDFGTGYSSLSYLKKLPVHKIKIDQSLVHSITSDPDDTAIIYATIMMAKNLKLKVIAEGVETPAQLEFLQTQGCDQYQGNFMSKPMLPVEMASFIIAH